MTPQERDAAMVELEGYIDRRGIEFTLRMLSEIAAEKAMHVETTWQDAPLARLWMRIASRIESCAQSQPIRDLSATEGRAS